MDLFASGVEAARKGDAEKAAGLLEGAVRQHPQFGLRDTDGAAAAFQQAATLGGARMGAAHKYLGGIYWQRKEYRRAADELGTYLRLTPKAADAEQIKGTIKELRSKQ